MSGIINLRPLAEEMQFGVGEKSDYRSTACKHRFWTLTSVLSVITGSFFPLVSIKY